MIAGEEGRDHRSSGVAHRFDRKPDIHKYVGEGVEAEKQPGATSQQSTEAWIHDGGIVEVVTKWPQTGHKPSWLLRYCP
jgi:hypothetical protein